MTVVTGTTIGGGLITPDQLINRRYFSNLLASVTKKRTKYSRIELKELPLRSSLIEASTAWNALSSGDKTLWQNAALVCGLSAYNLFIQDKVYRIINNLAGNAVPSTLHQYKVGHLYLPNSSGYFVLKQVGTNVFTFPASLHLHKKTVLTDENPSNGYIKVTFKYKYNDGGGEQTQTDELTLSLNEDWASVTVPITEKVTQTEHWELLIQGNYLHGDLWFDNLYVTAVDGYVNFDVNCDQCNRYFFYVIKPNNSVIESVYL